MASHASSSTKQRQIYGHHRRRALRRARSGVSDVTGIAYRLRHFRTRNLSAEDNAARPIKFRAPIFVFKIDDGWTRKRHCTPKC